MTPIAEIKRALLVIDHHLRWIEDVDTANQVNRMLQRTAEHAENVYKSQRASKCVTCDVLVVIHPEMTRIQIHRRHKIDAQRM